MSNTALRRLYAEHKQLIKNCPEGLVAHPVATTNMFLWNALISGPPDTCFEGGVFKTQLDFPNDYPLGPPTMKFLSPMYHPNVYSDGRVCISILHAPGDDPLGYESSSERWSPVQSVEKILLSVISMLAEPNCDSPANIDAAKMWRENRPQFEVIAKRHVKDALKMVTPEQVEKVKIKTK